jgi:hypothetical protein
MPYMLEMRSLIGPGKFGVDFPGKAYPGYEPGISKVNFPPSSDQCRSQTPGVDIPETTTST